MRVLADQENFRRRVEREREDAVRFAATQLIKDLLQTADNLSRALESLPPDLPVQNAAMRNLLAGVAASEPCKVPLQDMALDGFNRRSAEYDREGHLRDDAKLAA